MLFTFGKYAGYALSDIPASYLALALEEFTLHEILRFKCRAELSRRLGLAAPVYGTQTAAPEPCGERVKRVYREMALRFHPDKGGSNEAMQAINAFFQALGQ